MQQPSAAFAALLVARLRPLAIALAAFAALSGSAHAGGTDIAVTSQQYATDLTVSYFQFGHWSELSRPDSSAAPLEEALAVPGAPNINAHGSADLLSVSASTIAYPDSSQQITAASARASTTTTLTFTALANQSSPVSLAWDKDDIGFYSFSVDVYDITEQQTVGSLSWNGQGLPPIFGPQGSIDLGTDLVASHLYALSLNVDTYASTEHESASFSIDGLNPVAVPEPGSAALLLAGLAAVGAFARRAQRRT